VAPKPDGLALGAERTRNPRRPRPVEHQTTVWCQCHNPSDPMGKLFFNILAIFAKFKAELI
jgi:hypothetical protein